MSNYDILIQFLKDNYEVKHGEFDDFYNVGDYTFMVTHQNNGTDWKHCTGCYSCWSRKQILLFKGEDSDPVLELAQKVIFDDKLLDQ